jgi:septal ring factor EnvC (AmiA/AmiB activator)
MEHRKMKDSEKVENLVQNLFHSLSILGVFALINLTLFIVQEIQSKIQQSELKSLESKISSSQVEVSSIEKRLLKSEAEIKALVKKIEQCKAEINEFESQAVNGSLQSPVYESYIIAIDMCNKKIEDSNNLISSHKGLYNQYETLVEEYNSLISRANDLSEKASTRVYIIPRRLRI